MYLYERIAEEKKRQEEKIRMYENTPKEPEEKRYVSLMGWFACSQMLQITM